VPIWARIRITRSLAVRRHENDGNNHGLASDGGFGRRSVHHRRSPEPARLMGDPLHAIEEFAAMREALRRVIAAPRPETRRRLSLRRFRRGSPRGRNRMLNRDAA